MAIVRVLRHVAKAVLALHRWFMKYSGTTMIIDNIEERRRLRRTGELPEGNTSPRDETDAPSQE